MIPWLIEARIEGVLPLERQAGVNVGRIRENFPGFKMIGGYNKKDMSKILFISFLFKASYSQVFTI